ncbi:DUF5134 domain-containing protein [Pseudonocardia sp. RS11V-5]|uniref:DUF5134 domain-containing protein n=1 Tax=Pseudonocardia terrae TaxID=2905831 RepID=UPI001E53C456|nr:DUF5134 domain-containing protein [Pseudonocardia terrae]MCE3550269.1 DUF5134 domain-containing protein [Pseudonocardia terrae]
MAWFNALLACVSLVLGLLHLVRLATARRDGRPAAGEAAHAVMGFGMAAMFSPVGDPVPPAVWIAAFGLSAAWFAALALRTGPASDDAGHHVVCGVAMLFMLSLGLGEQAAPAGGHAHHGSASPAAWTSVVAIVLAGYFAWHVMRCGDRFAAARRVRISLTEPVPAGAPVEIAPPPVHSGSCGHAGSPVEGRLAALRAPGAAAVAHLVMASSMAVMLLGMI